MRWPRRSMFIWRLGPVLEAEGSIEAIVGKALASGIDGLLIKIAEGTFPYRNTEGQSGSILAELRELCRQSAIDVWGWHVPRCTTVHAATQEAAVVIELMQRFALDGLIMDAEPGDGFFQGDVAAAQVYGQAMRKAADSLGKPLGICSPALPGKDPSWLERFELIASHADVSFPQTYYGATPSTADFLAEAETANADAGMPMIPVGAAWIGDDGGGASADDCVNRAQEFIVLCRDRAYPGHAFWYWAAAPPEFWTVLHATKA